MFANAHKRRACVAVRRHDNHCSCIPLANLVQLRRCEWVAGELARSFRIYFPVLGTS
jgi:hypothetical protein